MEWLKWVLEGIAALAALISIVAGTYQGFKWWRNRNRPDEPKAEPPKEPQPSPIVRATDADILKYDPKRQELERVVQEEMHHWQEPMTFTWIAQVFAWGAIALLLSKCFG